ncbi:MAG TPA: DUF4845 domain-containing protein [Nitrococcus sp.]|nr:DUF4845 domain-containing protein [Nitrococcus sp.]
MDHDGYQGGMTLVSWLVTLIGFGVAALVAIRLAPVYIEAYEVGSILQSMETDPELKNSTRSDILETFEKRLDINNINHMNNDLKVNEIAGGMRLIVDYQARVHLLGNLDAVANFHKEATIRN